MDNKSIANILYETAELMEVRRDDPFRIRSYRRAAEAIEGWDSSWRPWPLRHRSGSG